MKEHNIEVDYLDGMAFKTEVNGHELIIDAEEDFGGKDRGPRPKPLLLLSLIGCTSMDVVSLMRKMRVEFDDFKVKAKGELNEEHPMFYKKIHLEYHIWGKNVDHEKVEKCVTLSTERYCGVHYMLEKAAAMSHEIIYHN